MGSEIKANDKRVLYIGHKFKNCPEWVGIIKNGQLLKSYCPENAEFSFEDNKVERTVDYYYLKVIYPDGNCAFASPICVSTDSSNKEIMSKDNVHKNNVLPHYNLEIEFGEHIGRNKWYNANSLFSKEKHGFSQSFRDMTCHLGPDPILSLPDNNIVYPTMDAVIKSTLDGSRIEELYKFSLEDECLILTSLCKVGNTIQGAGYFDGKPIIKSFNGPTLDIPRNLVPVNQFFYKSEFISPSWLASDEHLFCVLCEREGVLFTQQKVIGYFQDGYPAFPVAVKIRSIDEIYVLDFTGCLLRYSFAAATTGKLVWKKELSILHYLWH